MPAKFIPGQSYATRSAADYDTIFAYEIIRRTDRSVWIKVRGEVVRRAVRSYDDGVEMFDPLGSYSMSPVIRADKTEADVDHAHRVAKKVKQVEQAPALTKFARLVEEMRRNEAAAPKLRPYQVETVRYITHRRELVEQPRATTAQVEALKVSATEVSTEARRVAAIGMLTRFFAKLPGKTVSREQIGSFLDIVGDMTDENFDDLDLIRQYLRGE